jgi:hypothetical protein
MRHDELLHGIKELERLSEGMWGTKALRAAVELHEPKYGDFPDIEPVCGWCTCHDCDHIVGYPCKTIRAIEGAFNADL